MNKCIFIYINQGFSVRYLLRSKTLNTLVSNSTQVIILSHNGDEEVFKNSFESDMITVKKFKNEDYRKYLKESNIQNKLITFRSYILNGKYNTRTVDDFQKIFFNQHNWTIKYGIRGWLIGYLWKTTNWLLKRNKFLRRLLITFETWLFSPSFHKTLFEKYSPDLVIVTALCGFEYNELFAREAKKYGIPVCCIVLSWDNTSGMGMPGYQPDSVIAWTANMKNELIELNDINPNKIFIGGVAHFDPYFRKNVLLSRKELCEKLILNSNKKIIFYATKSPKRFPWGPELLADLAKAINMGHIHDHPQILVRIHPLHYRTKNGRLMFQNILDEYDSVASEYSSVVLNIPETVSKKIDFDLSDSETILVSSLLEHSDVMLNMFSTMVIEAAIFDLPTVNVCIRERCKVEFGKSQQDIMVDYSQTHNQRVIQTGGVKTVFTMEDLYSAVNDYLENPASDSSARKRIVENEAGPYRGNAGEMIGKHILSLL